MSRWPSIKARRVLAALLRIGWSIKREVKGSHRVLARPGWADYTFAFHDQDEIGHGCLHESRNTPDLRQMIYRTERRRVKPLRSNPEGEPRVLSCNPALEFSTSIL